MSERMTLPVLPLRDFVLLPGVTAPINAGKPATLKAIEAALNTPERLVFAVSQREDVQPVTPEVLHTIGTVARIGQLQRGLAGMQLLLHGENRGIAMQDRREGRLPAGHRPRGRGDAAARIRRIPLSSLSPRSCGSAPPSWAPSPACPRRSSSRCSRESTSRAGSPTSSPATPTSPGAAPDAARDPLGRGAAAARAGPRPAPDQRAGGPGGHQVQGPGGARRPPARDAPARAAQGDPEGARRGRRAATTSTSCARSSPRSTLPAERPQGGRPRAGPPEPHRPRVDGDAGDPHLPRDHRRAAVEHAQPGAPRPPRGVARSSTRITTPWATSRTGCSSSSPSASSRQADEQTPQGRGGRRGDR